MDSRYLKRISIYIVFFIILCPSCQKEEDPQFTIKKLTGLVQKGPYINGTSITIAELDNNLDPTGKTFNTQIVDNKGSFEFNNVELVSPYVEIRADGFYYDEVKGEKSAAQLTLFGLADLSGQNTINVNILTQLEKSRVKYLMGEGLSFAEAKSGAQTDVLNIFGIELENMSSSDLLDISKQDDENAILLAISLMIQGNGSVGDLTELLANINTDIRSDGILNSTILDSMLISQASSLDLPKIRKNLEDRFALLGVDATIANFENYINSFLPGRLSAVSSTSDISCYGLNDGSINLSVTGGTPPYSYLWSNGETANSISNLESGNYSVTVTDSRFFSTSIGNLSIEEPNKLNIVVGEMAHAGYQVNNGAINISVSGGTAPYFFLWSNSSSSQNLTGLSPGTYTVQVTDANSCSADTSIQIFEESYLVSDVSCKGNSDGAIDFIPSSGTPPYTFQWSTGDISEDLIDIPAGNYSVIITDGNNNSFEIQDIVVSEPDEIIISANATGSQVGVSNGAIDINVTGGTPPYSYVWSNGDVSEDISGLKSGLYSVTITDAHQCIAVRNFIISEYITDERDGENYNIVSIGEQVWTSENLRFLPSVSPTDAGAIEAPYYYVYDFQGTSVSEAKSSLNYQTYGVLYNWSAAMNACPSGWHLPTDAEWIQLEMFHGMSLEEAEGINRFRGTDEGYKLKSEYGWGDYFGSNEYGFTALPGGARHFGGQIWSPIGTDATWWSSTDIDSERAYNRILNEEMNVFRYQDLKENGFSVRCIKD